jgi:ubiquinone/menaquinone biosynthesis C-methylase UbiE
MPDLLNQYKRPTGRRGRVVAALMNKRHEALTLWGLTKRAVLGKVFGIDYSVDMVEYSQKVNKTLIAENRVKIREGSVEKTGFPDNFFDLVTAIETYYFWPRLPNALQEIKRVLKPEGKLLLVNEMVKDGVYEVEHAEMIEKTQVCLFPLEEIRRNMQSVGFVNVQIFTNDKSPWNAILAQKQ